MVYVAAWISWLPKLYTCDHDFVYSSSYGVNIIPLTAFIRAVRLTVCSVSSESSRREESNCSSN